jgi:Fe-S cluster assembly protein SufD
LTANDFHFDKPRLAGDDVAAALNLAFVTDGATVEVSEGTIVDRPIEIASLSTKGGHAITTRSAVFIRVGAKARIVETYGGPQDADYQLNAAMSFTAAGRSEVSYARVQVEGAGALHVGTTEVAVMPDTAFDHLTVTAGAAVSRSQVFLLTGGDNARVGLWGATMVGGRQHADATLVINHAVGGSTTRVLYKSAIDGEANGIFQGKVIVAQDAQKTDAKMTSRALLLSENAQFSAKPELEIYADDVQCGHGATSGQIDPNELFYLMARGVPRGEAERLLVEAFLDDAVDRLGDGAIGAPLKALASDWLARRGSGG